MHSGELYREFTMSTSGEDEYVGEESSGVIKHWMDYFRMTSVCLSEHAYSLVYFIINNEA